jgi:hypothetical protein
MTRTTVSAQTEAQNVTAFSAVHHGRVKLAIFNKAANAAAVKFEGAKTAHEGKLFWLQAPRIDSKEGVTFGASSVGAAGEFQPKPQQTVAFRHGAATLNMPAYSAAYIEA